MQLAVEGFRDDRVHQRAFALNLVGMGTVHLLMQEPEEAAEFTEQAIAVAKHVRSERVNTRIRKTTHTAVRDFAGVPAVARLAERLSEELPEVAESA
jgi:hypothetical protein